MTSQSHEHKLRELFDRYEKFRYQPVRTRRFTQAQMLAWISHINSNGFIGAQPAGVSAEGRTISLFRFGTGSTAVLLWSQMHGDEPTATMALLDIMNFLKESPDHPVVQSIRTNLTLLLVPMLNPDGAERFTRRTSQQVDVNRDALALQSPEARILKSVREQYQPAFGFNLHDQETHYTVGSSRNITAIALLAPPVDEVGSDDAVRLRAKHVASRIATSLRFFIPENIARWNESFEPRAFGENMQRWGTSTVLIESGGWRDDPEKMFLRKLNAVILLDALDAIADASYAKSGLTEYESIPLNSKNGFDLVIRNAQYRVDGRTPPVRVDIGVNYTERTDGKGGVQSFGVIADMGDLHTFGALEERDAHGKALDAAMVALDRSLSREELGGLLA